MKLSPSRILALTITTALAAVILTATAAEAAPTGSAAKRILGTPRSGYTWHTGVWTGSPMDMAHVHQFEAWRGRKADIVTTYSPRESWSELKNNSWTIDTYRGFPGRLNYGLAPIPDNAVAAGDMAGHKRIFAQIARGEKDDVWRAIARHLKAAGHGDAIVRLAWEPTTGWRHGADSTNAKEYRAMWNHIAKVMKTYAPRLKFDWALVCGQSVRDTNGRLDAFKLLYPGDKYVDTVGCSLYDWWGTVTKPGDASGMLRPQHGPGLTDLARFARAHGKGLSLGEWGLASNTGNGGGNDNPAYMKAMHQFLWANRNLIAFEAYFDDNTSTNRHQISRGQFPKAAAVYNRYW